MIRNRCLPGRYCFDIGEASLLLLICKPPLISFRRHGVPTREVAPATKIGGYVCRVQGPACMNPHFSFARSWAFWLILCSRRLMTALRRGSFHFRSQTGDHLRAFSRPAPLCPQLCANDLVDNPVAASYSSCLRSQHGRSLCSVVQIPYAAASSDPTSLSDRLIQGMFSANPRERSSAMTICASAGTPGTPT